MIRPRLFLVHVPLFNWHYGCLGSWNPVVSDFFGSILFSLGAGHLRKENLLH